MTRNTRSADPSLTSDPVLAALFEELTDRIQEGEAVDLDELVRRHPEYEDQLRRLVPALEALGELGGSRADRPTGVAAGPGGLGRKLGDFRILREVGRGGMGIVYEAEQLSLRRRVALKVLPFAASFDAKQAQRFRLEAQAAACLHHTHIVPVHAIGSQHGVPFYAMEFIDGCSLAEVIRQKRARTSPPGAGEDQGSGPRFSPADLRPRLAMEDRKWEAPDPDAPTVDLGVTSTSPGGSQEVEPAGSMEGQPSPHPVHLSLSDSSHRDRDYIRAVARLGVQAAEALEHAHQRGVLHRDIKPANLLIDHQGQLWITDFGLAHIQGDHSLTLSGDLVGTLRYMSPEQALGRRVLLDGRTDIYSLGVTLYELLTLTPAVDGRDRAEILRRIAQDDPPPLLKLNPAVPLDLETVVHKAMAREAADRYATPQALADDLNRFLLDRPILARPPTLAERGRKWCKRHKPLVATAAVCLLVSVIGLSVSTVVIAREQGRTRAALRQSLARQMLARRAVDEMYTQVAEKWLSRDGGLTPIQKDFLEKALAFYEEFARERSDDPQVRLEAARAAERVGQIRHQLGLFDKARESYSQALQGFRELAADFPDRAEYRRGVAHGLNNVGMQFSSVGRTREAEDAFREAITRGERIVAGSPEELAGCRELAESHRQLGRILHYSGRLKEAEPAVQQAVDLLDKLAVKFPADHTSRDLLAATLSDLAHVYLTDGRLNEAESRERQALELNEKQAAERPDDPDCQFFVAESCKALGSYLGSMTRTGEANEQFGRAVQILEALVAAHPKRPAFREQLAATQSLRADLLDRLDQDQEAEPDYRRALALEEALASEFPDVPRYRLWAMGTCNNLCRLLSRSGRHRENSELLARGYQHQAKLANDRIEGAYDRRKLALSCSKLAIGYITSPDPKDRMPERALELARKAVEIMPEEKFFQAWLGAALYRMRDWKGCIMAYNDDVTFDHAMAYWQLGEKTRALTCFELSALWLAEYEVAWKDRHSRNGGDNLPWPWTLRQLEAEAAELLGLPRDTMPNGSQAFAR